MAADKTIRQVWDDFKAVFPEDDYRAALAFAFWSIRKAELQRAQETGPRNPAVTRGAHKFVSKQDNFKEATK